MSYSNGSYYKWLHGEKKEAVAMDSEKKEMTLEEHDKIHHPDGYDPETDTCKLRDDEKKEDSLDKGESKEKVDPPKETKAKVDERVEEAEKEPKAFDPRWDVPKVRGGWTDKKILSYLKKHPSFSSTQALANRIAEFDTVDELKAHMFYHGSSGGTQKMLPSMCFSESWAEKNGGGGYGERYWGISMTPNKKIASRFSQERYVHIYPIIIAKGAKISDEPTMQDANEVEDKITSYWNDGIDAIRLGEWSKEHSEQELLVLNPNAMVVGPSDSYQVYHCGWEDNPLHIKSDDELAEMLSVAKSFSKMKKPRKPSWKSTEAFYKIKHHDYPPFGGKSREEIDAEVDEYYKAIEEYEKSDAMKAYREAEEKARQTLRF